MCCVLHFTILINWTPPPMFSDTVTKNSSPDVSVLQIRTHSKRLVGRFFGVQSTTLKDIISVYIEPPPREREKEKKYDRREKNRPYPHLLQSPQAFALLLSKLVGRPGTESYAALSPGFLAYCIGKIGRTRAACAWKANALSTGKAGAKTLRILLITQMRVFLKVELFYLYGQSNVAFIMNVYLPPLYLMVHKKIYTCIFGLGSYMVEQLRTSYLFFICLTYNGPNGYLFIISIQLHNSEF